VAPGPATFSQFSVRCPRRGGTGRGVVVRFPHHNPECRHVRAELRSIRAWACSNAPAVCHIGQMSAVEVEGARNALLAVAGMGGRVVPEAGQVGGELLEFGAAGQGRAGLTG
ncbi:hypothetical protein, partial [Streptomyces tibetensis]|uniref:hypothetical protein n=1 Tax=Streptomyces tibetensis TaxID=2382123 RepID=UPI0033E29C4B